MSSAASSASAGETAGPAPPHVPPGRWPVVAVRALAVLAWTTAMAALVVVLRLATAGRARAGARARRWVVRRWGRGLARIAGVRIETEGEAPPRGSLVVSNHLGYLDIPVLDAVAPMVFVARADLRRWPFWGVAATVGGTIYVDRATRRDVVRVRREMGEAMALGDTVIVFAEATSTGGDTILPLKPALLADAAARGTPVHWLTLTYRTPPDGPHARDQVCWWGNAGFPSHVLGLFALKRVECRIRFGDAPLRGTDRKALAVDLRRAMLERFEPVGGREATRGSG